MTVETTEYLAMLRRMIAAAGRRTSEGDEIELRQLIDLTDHLSKAIHEAVTGQRALGRSWAYIATATGTTRQAAQQRWGTPTEPRRSPEEAR